jgi:hypothetical protein
VVCGGSRDLLIAVLVLLVPLLPCLVLPATMGGDAPATSPAELLRYEALPAGAPSESRAEVVDVRIVQDHGNFTYAATITSVESVERVKIETDAEGRFLSGARDLSEAKGRQTSSQKLWREGQTVYVERGEGARSTEVAIPRSRTVAVDGSLLVLLRFFPFDTGTEWTLFMVDFSGASVTVSLRQTGTERVSVPAGLFLCYRIELVVQIPILRPTFTYWVAAEKPHFLVKSVGKRGPFTPMYLTVLTSLG